MSEDLQLQVVRWHDGVMVQVYSSKLCLEGIKSEYGAGVSIDLTLADWEALKAQVDADSGYYIWTRNSNV